MYLLTEELTMTNIYEKLSQIQRELKAPKNQRNNFGGYNYRSCEDILEAVKPHLDGCVLTVTDEMVAVGDRFYIKATARIATSKDDYIENSAFAREPLTKKGMDEAQITGATSSYARKYALNGLLAIDDTKDADATNTHDKEPSKKGEFEKMATAEKTATTKALNKAINTDTPYQAPVKKPLEERYTAALEYLKRCQKFEKNSIIDSVNSLMADLRASGKENELANIMAEYTRLTNIGDSLPDFQ